jgi:putative chitinase
MSTKTPAEWQAVLRKVAPNGKEWIILGFADALPELCDKYKVNTRVRQQHFISQCAHESDHFQTTKEYASGAAYNGRKDLSNTHPGDGPRFKGRGFIQLTGRYNYTQAAEEFKQPFIEQPELVERFPWAASVSASWWKAHGCNELADEDDVKLVTLRVNGGYNGLDSRKAALGRARTAFA